LQFPGELSGASDLKHASYGAASATAASKTVGGEVRTVDIAKGTLTLKSGSKTYAVFYKVTTKFTKCSAEILKAGVAVSVTGRLVKTVIEASHVAA